MSDEKPMEVSTDDEKDVPNDKVHFYKDNLGEWRWKRVAANGKTVGASSEGYQRLRAARANFRRTLAWMPYVPDVEIIEIDGEEV